MNTKLKHVQDWLKIAKQANWSVMRTAKLCGVSVRALELHFLKTWGMAPKVWLAEKRQKQAVELLGHGISVKEIAAELGYKHAHHFSREFKKMHGYCPTERRE